MQPQCLFAKVGVAALSYLFLAFFSSCVPFIISPSLGPARQQYKSVLRVVLNCHILLLYLF